MYGIKHVISSIAFKPAGKLKTKVLQRPDIGHLGVRDFSAITLISPDSYHLN